jgi:phosphomannomutase
VRRNNCHLGLALDGDADRSDRGRRGRYLTPIRP